MFKFYFMSLLTTLSMHQAFAGAVSGGGGGTLPAESVEMDQLEKAVFDSRAVIEVFLKGFEFTRSVGPKQTSDPFVRSFDKIYASNTDVFKLLTEVKISIEKKKACLDFQGNEVDASVNTGVAKGVCVSLPRLHAKLSRTNYNSEISALLLHEVSHLMGTDENEASQIQKIAVRFMDSKQPYQVMTWYTGAMQDVRVGKNSINMAMQILESGGNLKCGHLDSMVQSLWSLSGPNGLYDASSFLALTREKQTQYYFQLAIKSSALRDYLCSQPELGNSLPHRERYAKGFGTKNHVTAVEYFSSAYENGRDSLSPRFPLVTISLNKYTSAVEATSELETILQDLTDLETTLQADWNKQFQAL